MKDEVGGGVKRSERDGWLELCGLTHAAVERVRVREHQTPPTMTAKCYNFNVKEQLPHMPARVTGTQAAKTAQKDELHVLRE